MNWPSDVWRICPCGNVVVELDVGDELVLRIILIGKMKKIIFGILYLFID